MTPSSTFRTTVLVAVRTRGIRLGELAEYGRRVDELINYLHPLAPNLWELRDLESFFGIIRKSTATPEQASYVLLLGAVGEILGIDKRSNRQAGVSQFDRESTASVLPTGDTIASFEQPADPRTGSHPVVDDDFLAENQNKWLRKRTGVSPIVDEASSEPVGINVEVDHAAMTVELRWRGAAGSVDALRKAIGTGLAEQERHEFPNWLLDMRLGHVMPAAESHCLQRWLEEAGRDGVRSLAIITPKDRIASVQIDKMHRDVVKRAARLRLRIIAFETESDATEWLSSSRRSGVQRAHRTPLRRLMAARPDRAA